MRPFVVLGLDLSLGGTGMVALRSDWGGDWASVPRLKVGRKLPRDADDDAQIDRLAYLASEIRRFAIEHNCTIAAIEQYAFNQNGAHARQVGEVGGVARLVLREHVGLKVRSVVASTARKLICGKLPRKDVKAHVRGALTRMGMPTDWSDDEADAFVAGNLVLSEIGGFAFAVEAA